MNNEKYVTIKIMLETRKLLRLISATTGEQIVQVAQRLAAVEWRKLSENQGAPDQPDEGKE
jgi:hypothetical protein